MKIVWLCGFSNATVRERLDISISKLVKMMFKIARGHNPFTATDYGVWVSNAAKEFEKIDEVELHVISPCSFLKSTIQEFDINGIHYHFFCDENSMFTTMVYKQVAKPKTYEYKHNRRIIKKLIDIIKPDVVHLIGAENPQYSMALLDVPTTIPTIVQLQTLLNDPDFNANNQMGVSSYNNLSNIERLVLLRSDYIGTRATKYINIIKNSIKSNARFLDTTLAIGENINEHVCEKYYDFVYFASNINKSCEIALEAFGMAYQHEHSITLDVVGGFTSDYKRQLDEIMAKYGIESAVTFEGRLATHEDVINQIQKARFALLPLKIDLISGTIREAMANGLPVITTDTGELGTQKLNSEYQCALISPKFDCKSLAKNMIRLLNDSSLAEELRQNAFRRQREKYNNAAVANDYVEVYKRITARK